MACCVSSASARIRSRVARNRLPGEADPRYTRMRAGIQPGHLGNVGSVSQFGTHMALYVQAYESDDAV